MRTDRVLTCYRIGDPAGDYPIFDTEGARLYPGRWNTAASPVLYTSEHYSTALLEKLVSLNRTLPPNQHYVRITIPNGTSYEVFQPAGHPGWDAPDRAICKRYGAEWHLARRSALLIVPSIPARVENNVLINLGHPDARGITHDLPAPVWWDKRLFGSASAP